MVTLAQDRVVPLGWLRKIGAEMVGTFMLVFAGHFGGTFGGAKYRATSSGNA
jgi:glycerol uptake facilitator-like aquaporin